MYRLVVNFKIRASEKVFARGGALDVREHVLHRAGNDTGLVLVPRERERLAGRGLAVGEDDGIETIHGGADVAACDGIVNGLVLRAGEDLVEAEVLGLGCGGFGVLREELDRLGLGGGVDVPCGGIVGGSYPGQMCQLYGLSWRTKKQGSSLWPVL